MERVYYPQQKIITRTLVTTPLMAGMSYFIIRPHASMGSLLDWLSALVFALIIFLFMALQYGFDGKTYAIKISPHSIYGPVNPGRDMPIPFDEIDFEKTRKRKRVYSIHGDALVLDASLFAPEDVAEIWKAIDEFEKKAKQSAV